METDRARQIIVAVLQQSLIGKLNTSSKYSPQKVADAIIAKVTFDKSYSDIKSDRIAGLIIEAIVSNRTEMEKERDRLIEDEKKSVDPSQEKLLRNYVYGKLAAYQEILSAINSL
jgi:hypothetical protein